MPILRTIVFPGGFNLPLWTAMERGYFQARGIEIDLTYTVNSVQQLAGLIEGTWDIGLTGFDNVVAYQEGQGEADIRTEPDLFAFMGGDTAFLRLVVQRDIGSYVDLKGRTLSVDAMTTGFAFVLRKMIALNGLSENDVAYERAGGMLQRFEALKEGKHAGTLLATPFEFLADKLGMRVLQSASDLFPQYQGVCGATRRSWARANADVLTNFIRAYLEALDWLYDRSNRQSACDLLMAKVPKMGPELAAATYDVLLGETGGFDRKAILNQEGIKTVLRLRSEYGRPRKMLSDPAKYCDDSYYEMALRR
ncbi:MAG TPA: ABC transporter substrate-binding protein [Pseudolabrys sp.]|nr:ABC transporter substrate-binding protein [Pseudolabrys sp.]